MKQVKNSIIKCYLLSSILLQKCFTKNGLKILKLSGKVIYVVREMQSNIIKTSTNISKMHFKITFKYSVLFSKWYLHAFTSVSVATVTHSPHHASNYPACFVILAPFNKSSVNDKKYHSYKKKIIKWALSFCSPFPLRTCKRCRLCIHLYFLMQSKKCKTHTESRGIPLYS